MDTSSKSRNIATPIITVLILVLIAVTVWSYKDSPFIAKLLGSHVAGQPIGAATYSCEMGKVISVVYYDNPSLAQTTNPGEPPTPTGSVKLTLNDTRVVTLKQTISASGSRYANTDETFVFWSKGNTAFIEEGADHAETYSGCITSSDLPGTEGWGTYANAKIGFSIRFPQGYTTNDTYSYSNLGPKAPTLGGVSFTIPSRLTEGMNLSKDTKLTVEEYPLATSTCSASLFLDSPTDVRVVTENGVTYSVADTNGAGAGNFYQERVYAFPGTSPCLAVRYFIHSTNIGNYDPGTVREFDKDTLFAEFDQIRQTLVIGR